jgi:hypothetical protein
MFMAIAANFLGLVSVAVLKDEKPAASSTSSSTTSATAEAERELARTRNQCC